MGKPKSKSQIIKNRAKKKKRGFVFHFAKWALILTILLMTGSAIAGVALYYNLSRDLPKIESLADYNPPIITSVYSEDHQMIAEFFRERRIVVPIEEIPEQLKQAFISSEDDRFYKHKGVDFLSILRAFIKNVQAGGIVQGGSTITQQVTRSFLLSREKKYERKIKEALLAYRIEKAFTKDEILYLYLNQIYLGHGAYGVQAAAGNMFGKDVKDLNLAECALMAGLPQAPGRNSPFHFPERAIQRQIYVLNRMAEEGYITQAEAAEAINTPLDIKPRRNIYLEKVPVYTEHVRRYVEKKYGRDVLYTEGLKIYTAVNIDMQKAAQNEVTRGLRDLDRRQGYRGPLKQLAPEEIETFSQSVVDSFKENPPVENAVIHGAVIHVDDKDDIVTVRMGNEKGIIPLKDMEWARKPNPNLAYYAHKVKNPSQVLKIGDVIEVALKTKSEKSGMWDLSLEQTPASQAALLCIEAETGLVKVMVGGRDFMESQFNRAIQSRRQPGSAFKPIIYAAALDKGYTPATEIIDSPVVLKDDAHDYTWKPKNYGKKFYGPTLLRDALANSRNVVTIKILQSIGVDYIIEYARKMGIESNLSNDLSLALGSSGISLLEIVGAYSIFTNQGYMVEPTFVTKIEDRFGNILEEMNPLRKKVLEKDTAYIITNLLESVVQNGTGQRIKALGRPVAGKTGTTNNLFDAWFVGYTPQYITGVWVGNDAEEALGNGETGSRAASPIFLEFMKTIHEGVPERVFPVPEGVVFAKIDSDTGLLPIPESKNIIFECFKEGTVPTEYTKKPDAVTEPEEFFKTDI